MRYLTMTYVTRANGKIDEVMAVTRNIKRSDLQMCNVILDFKKLAVVNERYCCSKRLGPSSQLLSSTLRKHYRTLV